MNFIVALISEVEKRPLLWNKYDNEYSNRPARDCEWEKIAKILKRDKDFIQQKWRNLRDQFQRECKKVKVPFDNPTKPYIQYYRGKWIYFQQMLFLKDMTSKIGNSCYSSPELIEIREEDIKEEVLEFEDYNIFADHVNNGNNESEQTIASFYNDDTQGVIEPKIDMVEEQNLENEQLEQIGRKRKASETMSESVVSVKCERLSVTSTPAVNTEEQCEIDDDLHFVKSLVPFFKKLSPIRKLLVRNEIQNILIRESLCDKCRIGTNSCHST